MALYRLEAKIIGRTGKDQRGKPTGQQVSVVAKAAYRSGQKLKDERSDRTFNYKSRSQQVVHSEIIAPETAPAWLQGETSSQMRERLWNTIEKVEKRKDSQLAREFIAALPVELNEADQVGLVRGWTRDTFTAQGYVVDFSVHRSKDGKNPHAHILVTTRPVEIGAPYGFGKKISTVGKFNGRGAAGIGAKDDLVAWRGSWEKAANAALESAGEKERIDHRSLKNRGIARTPEPKIGVSATAMRRRGVEIDPHRMRVARQIKLENQIRGAIQAIKKTGEVIQRGLGNTWWERARIALTKGVEQAKELLRSESSSWQAYLKDRGKPAREGPDLSL